MHMTFGAELYLLGVALLLGGGLNALRCDRRRSGGDLSSG